VTLNPHDAVCRLASTAVQLTGVDPIGYVAPLVGVHVVVIGVVPPVAVGVTNFTATGNPFTEATVCGAGQDSTMAGGFDGPDGLSEQPAKTLAQRTISARRRSCGMKSSKLREFRMVACGRMTAKRLSPPQFGAIACGACALWVSFGSLAVTDADGASRIGVLPSPWWLAATIVICTLVAFVARRRAVLLWLSSVVLLAWLPPPMPAATLIWVGPLRWWLWSALAIALLAPTNSPISVPSLKDPRRAPLIAAAGAACLYLLAAWQIFPQLPGGDEPHYLIITQSLLEDGDLQIENNHQRGDYEAYLPGPLKPHYLAPGKNGKIYSVHAPGLPVVIAPVFALFGYPGVLGFLAIVSGLGTALAWRAVWLITGDAAASWFGWAAVSLTVPFLFQAFTVYPDGFAATLVIAALLLALHGETVSVRALIGISACLALLPWLHSRFAVTAGTLAGVIVARQWTSPDRVRRIAAFAAIPVVGAIGWFLFFSVIYGTPNPAAPYGGYTQSSIANVPRGLAGLLFDQQFGVLANAPVYLCVLAGFVPLLRRNRRVATELAVVVIPYSVTAAFYYMWWGGFVSPARFLASILLPLAIPAGVWFAVSGTAARVLGAGGLLLSTLISLAMTFVTRGALVYNVRDGGSKILRWASPLVDLTTGLPSFFQTTTAGAVGRALIWLLAAAATAAAARWLDRRRAAPEIVALGIGLTATASGMIALSLVWRVNGAHPLMPMIAASRLLRSIDDDTRQLAVRYEPFHRVRVADVPQWLPPVSQSMPPRRPDDPVAVVTDAAAAVYTVDATVTGDAGVLTAGLDRLPGPLWSWDLRGVHGRWQQRLTVANDAHTLRFDADERTRLALSGVAVRAERRLAAHERVSDQLAWRAARYGPATVFLLDGRAYVEPDGSWIVGGSEAEFAIVRDRGSPVQLLVRNFAVDNTVVLESDQWRQDVALKAREERLFDLPIGTSSAGVVLRVRSAKGARPADVEPGNQDKRMLGCWIETR